MDRVDNQWKPASAATRESLPPLATMVGRGLLNRCPVCGKGHVFAGYLKVVPHCASCGAELGRVRADDAPPYFTIFAVGHIVVPLLMWTDKAYEPSMMTLSAIFLPMTLVLSLLFIRPIKGATVGLMYRLGFGRSDG